MHDMAHYTGEAAKWAIMIVGLLISGVLSYFFYTTITPPDKPWFAYLALGLTEGGFVLWFITFMLSKHHGYFKTIAMLMVGACGLASFIVAGTELHVLFQEHYNLATDTSAYNNVSLAIEVIFFAHLLSIMLELFGIYFSKNPFRGGSLPTPQPQYRVTQQAQPHEERTLEQTATKQLPAPRGPGFFSRFASSWNAARQPVMSSAVGAPVQDDDETEKQQAAEEDARTACDGTCGKVGVQPSWVWIRGNGKIYCPECYELIAKK